MKNKNNKVNLADEVFLERKEKNEVGKEGYNFVGSIDHWTSSDEQKMKVSEIENKTNNK